MFKKFLAIALACSMIVPLAACKSSGSGSSTNGTSGSTSSAVSNKPITLNFWTDSLKPNFTDFINGLDNTYHTQNPNVSIVWTDLPEDTIPNKLVTSIASGNAPDVVNLYTDLVAVMAGKGALVDMNTAASDAQKSIYVKSIYASNTLGSGVYGFPWYITPNIVMYNKALFQQAGIATPPANYNEMFDAAKTMKEKTGKYLMIPTDVSEILAFNGVNLLTDDKKKAAFNTPDAVALLQKFEDGIKAGYIYPSNWNDNNKMIQEFSTSHIAMMNSGAQAISQIKSASPAVYNNIAVAMPMLGSSGKVAGTLMSLSVVKASKNVQAAIAFANYITNDQNQLAFCKQVSIFPTTTKAAADPFFTSNTTTIEGQANAMCAKALADSVDLSVGVSQAVNIKAAIDNISQDLANGVSPQSALSKAEKKVNSLILQK